MYSSFGGQPDQTKFWYGLAKAVYYRQNGEGRDTYIMNNNGGLNIPREPQVIEIGNFWFTNRHFFKQETLQGASPFHRRQTSLLPFRRQWQGLLHLQRRRRIRRLWCSQRYLHGQVHQSTSQGYPSSVSLVEERILIPDQERQGGLLPEDSNLLRLGHPLQKLKAQNNPENPRWEVSWA